MGAIFGVTRIKLPFGAPPCGDELHHHQYVPAPKPAPGVPDLEYKVGLANDYVEREFQALLAIRYKMKDLAKRSEQDWDALSKPLEGSCTAVRTALEKLGEQTSECENAQHTDLANLFEKRDKTKDKAAIKGCANFKVTNELSEASDCKCGAGAEHDGCRGAKIDSDHTLLCTQLRKRVLPSMALWRMTGPGGACFVNAKSTFNMGLLAPGQPADFELPSHSEAEESMPPLLLALPQPPRRRSPTKQRGERDGEAAAERARAFL